MAACEYSSFILYVLEVLLIDSAHRHVNQHETRQKTKGTDTFSAYIGEEIMEPPPPYAEKGMKRFVMLFG